MHTENEKLKESIDLWSCSYINWYKIFEKIAIKSSFVPLNDEIIQYLLDEKIILPKECYQKSQTTEMTKHCGASSSFNDADDDEDDAEIEVIYILMK